MSALALAAAPAHACYTVKFKNDSEHDVTAVWTAAGCAGIHKGIILVCEDKKVKVGETQSYNYNWGVTRPAVIPYVDIDSRGNAITLNKFWFYNNRFTENVELSNQSPDSCGHTYEITLSEDDVRNNSF